MELKPCPFCGNKARSVKPSKNWAWNIGCENCGCVLFTNHKSQNKAISEWNTRASPPQNGHGFKFLFILAPPHICSMI